MSHTIWINSHCCDAHILFTQNLRYLIENVNPDGKPLAFACIGSSRITGDNLGPFIGTILTRSHYPYVYGTLDHPLNALTIPSHLPLLNIVEQHCCLIAIDAAIGNGAESGHLTLSDTGLHPGSALRRNLPSLGRLHITGVFQNLDSPEAGRLMPVYCRAIALGLLDVCRQKK